MNRFLRYSMEHGRRIRALFTLEGKLVQKTVLVVSYTEECVTMLIGTGKKPVEVPMESIFSFDYARGDHGED